MALSDFNGKIPLIDYPWHEEVDRLAEWAKNKDNHVKAFCFDLIMSLAYVDATSGLEKYIEACPNTPQGYNSHIGFINLCSPCYEKGNNWVFQKAAKPQSGALGKLSSEVILRLIKNLYPQFETVLAIGGTESADAMIEHNNGNIILAEVKSAPLLTYPMIFNVGQSLEAHESVNITSSQLRECDSALYLHNQQIIPLGKIKQDLWPFKPAIDFITDDNNVEFVSSAIQTWLEARNAYQKKDRKNKYYYLANASGHPPAVAKTRDKWPLKESVSDGKTSAGMDRTDDIKKGIYQVLKIGTHYKNRKDIKTALISNLPAYRHGEDYVSPFVDMLWGYDENFIEKSGEFFMAKNNLRRVFDYIITLENPVLRELKDDYT